MNINPATPVNTRAILAVMAVALIVGALFGTPSGATTPVPHADVASQVAGR